MLVTWKPCICCQHTLTLEVCCICSSHTGHNKHEYIACGGVSDYVVCVRQTVPVEFPSAWWSPEDRPHDGGLRHTLLWLQCSCLPVDRWVYSCPLPVWTPFMVWKRACVRGDEFKWTHTSLCFLSDFYFFFPEFVFFTEILCALTALLDPLWTLCCFLSLFVCVCIFLFNIRHVLHPVICHHHAQHQPPQPLCKGQDHAGAFHLHEQRHQQWRESTRWPALGENHWPITLSNQDTRK